MPLVIGTLNATVEITGGTPVAPPPRSEIFDEERRRIQSMAAHRLEQERRMDQRDPDRLGAQ
jgi:hypothetical protein